jgi:hypothetical protein
MPSESFRFKHVRSGAPIGRDELPKLPPQAAVVMLNKVKELGLSPTNMSEADATYVLTEIMVDMVFLSLQRLDRTVSRGALMNDEDLDEVKACFLAIQDANPTLFPKLPVQKLPVPADADPKGQPSAPALKPTAQ